MTCTVSHADRDLLVPYNHDHTDVLILSVHPPENLPQIPERPCISGQVTVQPEHLLCPKHCEGLDKNHCEGLDKKMSHVQHMRKEQLDVS